MIPTDDWIHENNSSLLLDIGNWSQRKWVFPQASSSNVNSEFQWVYSSARSRNRKKRPGEDGVKETMCPICNDRVMGMAEDLNAHVEMCLKQVQALLA